MGMFDYIDVDVALLPSIPSELQVKSNGRFIFQTKDTEMQGMSMYIQDASSRLMLQRTSGEWVPSEPTDQNATFVDKLALSIGSYVVKDTWYEEQQITDTIEFYTSLDHPESDNSDRFVYGWVEYSAKYECGTLQCITLKEYKPPVKYTDEELENARQARKKAREETRAKMIARRKENPTPEQKLIDYIDTQLDDTDKVYDDLTLIRNVNNIRHLISVYRERYDPFYSK